MEAGHFRGAVLAASFLKQIKDIYGGNIMGDLGFGKPIFWAGLAAGIVTGALAYRCVQKRCAAKKAKAALPQASLEELLQQKAEIEALIEAQQA